jgi:flagellar P-ring protein precursor FlgI
MHRRLLIAAVAGAALAALAAGPARAERIKDIVDIQGIRGNPLQGYGLVVGLAGTGDTSNLTPRALANVLRRQGLSVDPADLQGENVASVIVRAELPPFAREGQRIDVEVSAIGDADSLQGGTLLMTPLRGADGQVYAVAHGPIIIGGFAAAGQAGSVSKNHTTVGRIPGGANVERAEPATFVQAGVVTLNLKNPDFSTAEDIRAAIDAIFPAAADAVDAGTVRVRVPQGVTQSRVAAFLDRVGLLEVAVDAPAVVVINERTGTIIVGENVGISTVAISHGNLSIVTQEKDYISQPLPFARAGTTARTHRTEITAIEEQGPLSVVDRKVSVQDLARALNAMGLTPRDLISIFQALKQAGALQAELKVI